MGNKILIDLNLDLYLVDEKSRRLVSNCKIKILELLPQVRKYPIIYFEEKDNICNKTFYWEIDFSEKRYKLYLYNKEKFNEINTVGEFVNILINLENGE